MAEITVAELLVRCLHAEEVDAMFGIIDGSHVPFIVHTPKYGIRHINTHHEEGAVHIAEAYARLTRKPAVVIGSPGPGAANMLAGLTSAQAEGHPVIAIATTRRRLVSDPDRGGAWQATNLVDMARPITKYSAMVRQWERLPEMMRAAFRAAMTGRPGPAFIAIPDELLTVRIDESAAPVFPAARYRLTDIGAGNAAAIEQAAQWLAGATNPIMHAGKGVLWSSASEPFVALAEHLGATMTASLGARGAVPEDHPHYLMLLDQKTQRLARQEADVVLIVGSRLGEYDGWGMPPAWGNPAAQKTIQIDSDPMSIGLNRPVDLGIVGDARAALQALLAAVQNISQPQSEHERFARYRQSSLELMMQGAGFLQQSGQRGVNPGQMVMTARQFFPAGAITVLDGGNTTLWGIAFSPIFRPDSFFYSVKMGYLGTGLPFAIGAKLAAPDRPVYLITGDGAMGFNIMELETALRENTPVVVIVAVDDGWGMERSAYTFQGYPPEDHLGIDLHPQIRYDLIAQGLGCYGEKVEAIGELQPALQRAVESNKPAVIHVTVDAAVNANPPGYKEFRQVRTL